VREKFDPAAVLATIEREKVNTLTIVGDAFARPLLDEIRRGSHDLSSLMMIGSGGAPLSARCGPAASPLDCLDCSDTTDRSWLEPGAAMVEPPLVLALRSGVAFWRLALWRFVRAFRRSGACTDHRL